MVKQHSTIVLKNMAEQIASPQSSNRNIQQKSCRISLWTSIYKGWYGDKNWAGAQLLPYLKSANQV